MGWEEGDAKAEVERRRHEGGREHTSGGRELQWGGQWCGITKSGAYITKSYLI